MTGLVNFQYCDKQEYHSASDWMIVFDALWKGKGGGRESELCMT